jgi:hypothetical protein
MKKENGTPAFAGMTVLFKTDFYTFHVMPAQAGIPCGFLIYME